MNTSMTPTDTAPASEPQNDIIQRPYFHAEEDENGASLQVALPGVRKEDLKLTFHESSLMIEGKRSDGIPDNWKTLRDTNPATSYGLNIRLTSRLDGTQTSASFEQGILTLKVPISEDAKPRVIEVK
jgi:HSP20 family protein